MHELSSLRIGLVIYVANANQFIDPVADLCLVLHQVPVHTLYIPDPIVHIKILKPIATKAL